MADSTFVTNLLQESHNPNALLPSNLSESIKVAGYIIVVRSTREEDCTKNFKKL
jgi:hypothetical protein